MPTSSPGRLFKGDSPPTEQEQSDLWVSQTDNNLYRHDGLNFKVIAPAAAGSVTLAMLDDEAAYLASVYYGPAAAG
jgi:hypothetical protein